MKLNEMLEKVDSKESFLEFVAALRKDLASSRANEQSRPSSPYSPDALDWENPDLGRFLEAMQAWTEDMGDIVPVVPSWRTFAQMLIAAKSYE